VLLKAALAHVQCETIHPFRDGNRRLGRLLITRLLSEHNVLSKPWLSRPPRPWEPPGSLSICPIKIAIRSAGWGRLPPPGLTLTADWRMNDGAISSRLARFGR
jgi:hypothetical protein